MIETWVLIVLLTNYYSYGAAVSVPGYASEQKCEAAAKEVVSNKQKAFCIPGPPR